ncbi:hypothetical protein MSPP1_003189 [Malassezia sp. CBS 17886]|nr:hypothetical protein MSPP1_003189 [Malassezia sp. CBS 17886]
MVRVKKRASKRLSVKQREKVHKKVREHHRKQRRDAKRSTQWKSRRRDDPGIPNSFPFKEELLNEIEQKRCADEELRQARKDAPRGEDEEEESEVAEELVPAPGFEEPLSLPHAPVLQTPLSELLSTPGDVKTLIYAVDARDAPSFHSEWLERVLPKRLHLVYALAKADLVPSEVLAAWIYRLSGTKRPVFAIAADPAQPDMHAGVDALHDYLADKARGNVAVVGLENSGKTAVASALQGSFQRGGEDEITVYDSPPLRPARTEQNRAGDEPDGEREEEDEDESVDGGGDAREQDKLLWTLIRNKGAVQRAKDPVTLVQVLLSRVAHPEDLMLAYGTPAFGSFVPKRASLADDASMEAIEKELQQQDAEKAAAVTEQFLIGVARSRGRLKRHGIPDVLGAARLLLRDWSHAALGYYVKPLDRLKDVADADKLRWTAAQEAVAALSPAVVSRKQWRERWGSRELRLKPLKGGVFARQALEFVPVAAEDMEDEMDEDVPVYGGEEAEDEDDGKEGEEEEGEDEEDDEEEDEEEEDEDEEDEEEEEDDGEDEEEDDEEDEEEAAASPPRGKRRAAPLPPRKKRPVAVSASDARPSRGRAPGPSTTRQARAKPVPGQAYDLNAYF